jgi:hypothetical protein
MAGRKKNQRPKAAAQRPSSDIPKFDLADEIMAQQRKITGKKRKRRSAAASWHGLPAHENTAKMAVPLAVSRQQVEPISHTIEQPGDVPLDQEQIIADIVARDIERMLQGEGRNRS